MDKQRKRLFFIRFPYFLGIAADGLWAVALFFPPVFSLLTGNPDFNPDMQLRLTMAIAGSLMTGWTILLIWAVREPIERRFVILITAFPVVFGLFIVALIGVLNGNTSGTWILIKTSVLFAAMIYSYFLASKVAQENL